MEDYQKLVRDNIPDIIRANGQTPVVRTLGETEYLAALKEKLAEEAAEYIESGDTEELCDVEEVLRALLDAQDVSYGEMDAARRAKAERNGAFRERLWLEGVEDGAPTAAWESREVASADEKSTICGDILRALPSWFGVETSIVDYAEKVKRLPLYAAFAGDAPVGFAALKAHNPDTAELCVMGVRREWHRRGIGAALVARCERYCREHGMRYLTVKTLDASAHSESYEKTRAFYHRMGFVPLEVFPLFWDADNPCLFLVKAL